MSQELNKLQVMLQHEKMAKEEKSALLKAQIQKFKEYPEIDQFKMEALESSKSLSRQLDILCHKISRADPLCVIATSLIEKVVNTRLEFEDADEKISGFLTWQDTDEGIVANLPKIQESHKEILFAEWETQLIKEEQSVMLQT